MTSKKIYTLLAVIASLGLIAGCGATKQAVKPTEPVNLEGEWRQKGKGLEIEGEPMVHSAVIKKDSIEIYWGDDTTNSASLYWAGSYTPPTSGKASYQWESKNDKSRTEKALLTASDDTKAFSYKDGVISYKASGFGETKTITLERGKAKSATSSQSSEAKKKDSSWNESTKTFTTDKSVLKIDKLEKAKDYEGKPAVKLYFTLTNKAAEAKDAQMLFLDAVNIQQKTKNTSNDLDMAMMPFDDQEENHLDDNINPGGTISGFYPYELENETDPILVLFEKNYETVATYEMALK